MDDMSPKVQENQSEPATPPVATAQQTTPLQCLVGAIIAGAIAVGAYFLTQSIAQSFAGNPFQSDNMLALRIAIAVRTLVVGIVALATGVFGIAGLGLLALGVQLTIQQVRGQSSQ
jgi:hypothetical protein